MRSTLFTVPLPVVERALRGALEVEHTSFGLSPRRLPLWTRDSYDDQKIEWVANQTTGIHLDFETTAQIIELDVHITRTMTDDVVPPERLSTFIAVVDGVETSRVALNEGTRIRIHADGSATTQPSGSSLVRLQLGGQSATPKRVKIWLPHHSWVQLREVRASAPAAAASTGEKTVWLHHGSSISHCTNAASPLETWPTLAAQTLDVDLFNLGFNGQSLLDPVVAASIRDCPADMITVKVGINIVNVGYMRGRELIAALHRFLDIVREGHPLTPLALISPVICPIHETTPGPTVRVDGPDERYTGTPFASARRGALTLQKIRKIEREIVQLRGETDPNLFYLDGRQLLGRGDAGHLFDDVHPDGEGYRIIAENFIRLSREEGSPLERALFLANQQAGVR